MSKYFIGFAILTAVSFAAVPGATRRRNPRVIIVAAPPAGTRVNPASGNGSEQRPFITIQQGVDAASPGDTVRVERGTYRNVGFGSSDSNGPVVYFAKGGSPDGGYLTLAADKGAVLIQFDGIAGIQAGPNVSYVKIQNFSVEGPAAGLTVAEALRHRLDDPPLAGLNGQGITFKGPSDHIEISSNEVTGACSSGIHVNNGDYITIQNNRVSRCTQWTALASSALVISDSISIDTVEGTKMNVLGNTVFNNRNFVPFFNAGRHVGGAHIPFPGYGEAGDDRIIDGSGVYLTRNNDHYKHGRYLVADNVTVGNGINGISVHYTNRATLTNNTIADNGTVPSARRQNNSGLAVNHSLGLEFYGNRVQVNVPHDWAIRFFEPVTYKAKGNFYCGGRSQLTDGAAVTNPFWFGPVERH